MKKAVMVVIVSIFLIFTCFAENNDLNVNEIDKIFKITKDLKNIENAINNLEKNGIKELLKEKPNDMKDGRYIQYLNDYAYFLSETDRYKEAIPILERVILLEPNRVVAYLNLGDCYYKDYLKNKKQSDLDEVIDKYDKYIGLLKKGAKIPERIKSLTDYKVKKYKDEEYKQINVGNYSFDFGNPFVNQYEEYDNVKKYTGKYKENMIEDKYYKNFYIIIKPIKNPNVTDKKSTLAYIEKTFGQTNEIKIDLTPLDDYDEINPILKKLIKIRKNKMAYYILFFKDSFFLVESNIIDLEDRLFGTDFRNLYYYKYQVDCGGKDVAIIEKTYIDDNLNPVLEYEIMQEKTGLKFTGKVTEKGLASYFTLKDSKNNVLLTLSESTFFPDKFLYFIDKNKDGYIDIGYLYEWNTHHVLYILYIWNNSKKIFEKQEGIYEDDIYDKVQPSLQRIKSF